MTAQTHTLVFDVYTMLQILNSSFAIFGLSDPLGLIIISTDIFLTQGCRKHQEVGWAQMLRIARTVLFDFTSEVQVV